MADHVIPKRGEKYTVNVLELAQILHEHSTGQSDTHSDGELKSIRDYLVWRVEEAWVPSAELARPFDDAVSLSVSRTENTIAPRPSCA